MDASMNSAIRATIPLLTAPLADICAPNAVDGLHVALMSTLSAHLSPTWDPTRPLLGAPLRTLHLSISTVGGLPIGAPLPIAQAARQIGVKSNDWVALIVAHHRTTAMSISINPGVVTIQLANERVPRVYWQEDNGSSSSRSASPVSPPSSYSSLASETSSASLRHAKTASAEAPWNARKSRLPSLVATSARQAQLRNVGDSASSASALMAGTPRTPRDVLERQQQQQQAPFDASWTFPPAQQQQQQPEQKGWVKGVLGGAMANAQRLRATHGHARTESVDSWVSAQSASSSSTGAEERKKMLYGQLALNMSQLSLASTSTTSSAASATSTTAPSLMSATSSYASSATSISPSDECPPFIQHPSASSYEFELPASRSTATIKPSSSTTFDLPLGLTAEGNIYIDDALPSPLSPTASAYAYVDHARRKSVMEYECGRVGVLGGAVMLGVPEGAKRGHSRNSSSASGNGAARFAVSAARA
ncbi:hypothetical protein DL93DRAFT_2072331 [Clavulina sp. PMI_390]|nr:hypothetical protein DL93DRAFT_2072331 [Clavulina sp. PMI_390]